MDGDSIAERVAPLALDRLAMARIERCQEVVETAVVAIVPMELLVGPLQESKSAQEFPFGFGREGEVRGGCLRCLAQGDEPAGQNSADLVRIFAVSDQQARAGDRGKRN